MEIIKTNIPDLVILKPKIFKDTRGYFMESYKKEYIKSFCPVQDNESFSKFGVIRGLHFQIPPYDQAKLIRVLNGQIMDVAVDLRTSSPTYGKHESIILSSQNKKQLYVPRGFAHGFICLSKTAKILYKVDNMYSKKHELGIIFNDFELKINWIINSKDFLVSEKDLLLPKFNSINNPF